MVEGTEGSDETGTIGGKVSNAVTAIGIPNATIVDKDGKVITSGHGSIVLEWKDHCKK